VEKTYSSVPGVEERAEPVCCPLCGEGTDVPFFVCGRVRFVRCPSCSLVYQNPRPAREDVKKRYDSRYFSYERSNEENFFNLMVLGLRDIRFHEITGGVEVRRFLDIGCATGMLLEDMRRRGWEVQGVDVCAEAAEFGRKSRKLDIFAGTLSEARFEAGRFSVAHFSHLIEHVPDPRGFLSEVHRVLAPGGLALLTTPNIGGLQARIFGTRWRSLIPDHLTLFSKETLGRLLRETGFSVQTTATWGGLAEGYGPRFLKRPLDRLAKKWGFGDVMLFVARRLERGQSA
jgi:2-polyprenyl-3-methyl-5-hydroxy-6-metoxy-1,4-benzoquinol methylase